MFNKSALYFDCVLFIPYYIIMRGIHTNNWMNTKILSFEQALQIVYNLFNDRSQLKEEEKTTFVDVSSS